MALDYTLKLKSLNKEKLSSREIIRKIQTGKCILEDQNSNLMPAIQISTGFKEGGFSRKMAFAALNYLHDAKNNHIFTENNLLKIISKDYKDDEIQFIIIKQDNPSFYVVNPNIHNPNFFIPGENNHLFRIEKEEDEHILVLLEESYRESLNLVQKASEKYKHIFIDDYILKFDLETEISNQEARDIYSISYIEKDRTDIFSFPTMNLTLPPVIDPELAKIKFPKFPPNAGDPNINIFKNFIDDNKLSIEQQRNFIEAMRSYYLFLDDLKNIGWEPDLTGPGNVIAYLDPRSNQFKIFLGSSALKFATKLANDKFKELQKIKTTEDLLKIQHEDLYDFVRFQDMDLDHMKRGMKARLDEIGVSL